MSEFTRPIRRLFARGTAASDGVPVDASIAPNLTEATAGAAATSGTGASSTAAAVPAPIAVDIPESDPLLAYLQTAAGPVEVARLELDSPAITALRAAGVALVVPLVSQGELIGTLNLGPRLSEQDYSTDDRRLLTTLAAQAAPAIRVAQLVREQAAEAAERERLEQEMRVATLIQQQFLPRQLPDLPQWQVAAYYGPARAVGGDFYDFIEMPGGRIGIAVGDVTDKGVPAALVMARTHSVLRAEASRSDSPATILARANELLVPEMPARMFVTCLFAILEPETGRIVMANAGHNLPYIRTADGVVELRATGMPLGLLPGIVYEETEGVIAPGSNVLLYSDGLVEAHDPDQEMYGFPRLREAMTIDDAGSELLDRLLDTLHTFTGPDWEQEDDITLVTLHRASGVASQSVDEPAPSQQVTAFSIPGEEGNERLAMDRVAAAVDGLGLTPARLERLKTAVSETAMNAIEYGSQGNADVPVDIVVETTADAIVVRITDRALSGGVPSEPEAPDIERKLVGDQKPRGWGLFLIKSMVDSMDVTSDGSTQTVTLTMAREERSDG
ncbi:MAG TPA: SpoIIE family protein phosphatase [Candidatus Limnocylindrales bacterium]|jgi:serine phosphatase RsbU (regulator of sigma subunit)/anti-sigma regulatory factor (Ser/Thr protein kinase)|nr:SpoIIE family protein phosphatase [Candidatus Limnocylindrales bacterium]